MNRRRRRARKRERISHTAPGAAPGTLAVSPDAAPPVLDVIGYGADAFEEFQLASAEALREYLDRWPVLWVNVEGVKHAETMEALGAIFELHRLALEDATHTIQRAKVEEYGSHDFIIARMCGQRAPIETEQLAIFLGRGFVITCQEGQPLDALNPVRERLRKGHGRIRAAGADYLVYSILDAVVDSYFPALERIGDQLEEVEDSLLARPSRDTAMRIHELKRELLTLRRATWPLREAFNVLVRDESPLFRPGTRLFLRDCYDHVVRQIDLIETYREMCSDMMDLYLSSVSQRMNEIMKVLTLISTVFLPLTFIAGVYGMNFDPDASPWNMPELRWYWGYPAVLLLMAAVALLLLLYFRGRGWLGEGRGLDRPPEGDDRPGDK